MSKARFRGLTLVNGIPVRRARFRGLEIVNTTSVVKARFRGLVLLGTAGTPKARFSRLSLFGRQPGSRARLSRLSLYGGVLGALSANAGGGRQVDAMTTVVLDGTASTGSPTGYAWAQVSNGAPTVAIVGSGPIVAFVAPSTVAGCDVIIRLTVTLGPTTATDQATITVFPQLSWYLDAGSVWQPTQSAIIP